MEKLISALLPILFIAYLLGSVVYAVIKRSLQADRPLPADRPVPAGLPPEPIPEPALSEPDWEIFAEPEPGPATAYVESIDEEAERASEGPPERPRAVPANSDRAPGPAGGERSRPPLGKSLREAILLSEVIRPPRALRRYSPFYWER